MFGRKIKLFKLLGFQVAIDLSWFLILLLIVWTLAFSYFPQAYPQLSRTTYWAMGAIGALGLFVSIILHELAHSLVARRHGMEMKGITLFIFGGVAEMPDQPSRPGDEFKMAIAGPIASFLIAGICLAIARYAPLPLVAEAVFAYLGIINGILALFNLIPAFPLDGGRILRAAVWHFTKNLRRATRIASTTGLMFGWALIFLGALAFMSGNVIGGMWWFLIGLFISAAARMHYSQLLVRQALHGEPVRRFMKTDPIAVPADSTLQEFVDQYLYRYYYKLYPVISGGHMAGCITMGQVRDIPREQWTNLRVGEVMDQCSLDNTIRSDEDVVQALEKMNRKKLSRMLVVDDGELKGVLSLKDLLEFLNVKMELEEQR